MKNLVFNRFNLATLFVFGFIDRAESVKKECPESQNFVQLHEVTNYSKIPGFKIGELANYQNLVDVAILGSGPGGLAAAVYCGRSNLKPIVFTGDKPGGQLMDTSFVENIPGVKRQWGADIIDTMTEQAIKFGATIVEDSIIEVDFSDSSKPYKLITASGKTLYALVVIIATGSSARRLGIPGEDEYWGRGVAVCALCDCTLFRNLNVAIVGGGDAAIEEAILLSNYASSVTIFVRKDRMRAAPKMQDRLSDYPNISVVYNKIPVEIVGDDNVVTGLKYKDLDSENPDEIITKQVSGIFLAIGTNPNSSLFDDYLALNQNGYIIADRHQETSKPRVFAAGDVSDAIFRQAVIATATGTIAGLNATALLKNGGFNANNLKNYEHRFYVPTKKVTLNTDASNNRPVS